MTRLRIATLNTWKGDGDYPARLAAMIDGLTAENPDLIALQECLACPALGFDTAKALAEALGFDRATLDLRRKARRIGAIRADSTSGLAILSRWPIVGRHAAPLPEHPDDGDRAALLAEIQSPHGPIILGSVHLTHLNQAADLRQAQWQRLIEAAPDSDTVFLCGDFNAPAESFDLAASGFADSRTQCGTPARSTVIGAPSAACIDLVLFSDPGRWRPTAWQTALDRPRPPHGVTPSDHTAVIADFVFAG